jgi:hypothetical protein
MYAAVTKGDGNAADERFSSGRHALSSDYKVHHGNRITIMYRSGKFFRERAGPINIDLDVPEQAAALIEEQFSCTGKLFDKTIETLADRLSMHFHLRNTTGELFQKGRNVKGDAPHRILTCRPTAGSLALAPHQGISSSDRPMWTRMLCPQAT